MKYEIKKITRYTGTSYPYPYTISLLTWNIHVNMDIRHKFLDNCALVIKNSWNCYKYWEKLWKICTQGKFLSTPSKEFLKSIAWNLKNCRNWAKIPKIWPVSTRVLHGKKIQKGDHHPAMLPYHLVLTSPPLAQALCMAVFSGGFWLGRASSTHSFFIAT